MGKMQNLKIWTFRGSTNGRNENEKIANNSKHSKT